MICEKVYEGMVATSVQKVVLLNHNQLIERQLTAKCH